MSTTATNATTTPSAPAGATINGLDTDALRRLVADVASDPTRGLAGFRVTTDWKGGTRSDSRVEGWKLGGRHQAKRFVIGSDEPIELLGGNTAPNPQELLMASLNACMLVGYVAGAAMEGITLRCLSIETTGELDLRGFLGLDPAVKPGYEALHYTVRVRGNGTPEQYRRIHESVIEHSPNRWNIAQPIRLTASLVVE
ncbi:MAG TPA: OsmC family protein [Planctomycetota bacterium]|nr:OsmC family protein [Planctomycetota bacterium]